MRAKKMKTAAIMLAAIGATATAACDRTPRLEVRTFRLEHIRPDQARPIIEPYVFQRDGGSGVLSVAEGAVTVRETRDNLDQIARVLADFDQPSPDITLHFQLIEADGFTESDPRIAEVEDELRKVFQFRGYRLSAEAMVATAEGSDFAQGLRTSDGGVFELGGEVYRASPNSIRLQEIALYGEGGSAIRTTVGIRPGQTIVLGSSPRFGTTSTLFLTVRAEEVVNGPA